MFESGSNFEGCAILLEMWLEMGCHPPWAWKVDSDMLGCGVGVGPPGFFQEAPEAGARANSLRGQGASPWLP